VAATLAFTALSVCSLSPVDLPIVTFAADRQDQKDNQMPPLPENMRAIAMKRLSNDAAHWWIRDVTNSYGKLDAELLYWIIDGNDNSIIVVLDRNKNAFALTGREGLGIASDLLGKAYGGEPWQIVGVANFAKTIMAWHSDPRSHVTTPAFFNKQKPVLQSWLSGREKDARALQQVCREPFFTHDSGRWTLDFNAINRRGGIERWIVHGESGNFRITEVSVSTVRTDGTFYFPEEL
jgi:hypothetical protein